MSLIVSGYNPYYQLITESNGTDQEGDRCVISPKHVDFDVDSLVHISCGCDHTLFLYNNGIAFGVGDRRYFEKCTERIIANSLFQVDVTNGEKIKWMYSGMKYAVYLTEEGNVYLNNGKKIMDNIVYVSGNVHRPFMIDKNGVLHKLKNFKNMEIISYHLPLPVCDVAAGKATALALTTDGKIYGYGKLNPDQTKQFDLIGDLADIRFKRVFGRADFMGAITNDGIGFYVDLCTDRKLKPYNTNLKVKSMEFGYHMGFFMLEGDEVVCFGHNASAQLFLRTTTGNEGFVKPPLIQGVKSIYSGNCHSIACTKEIPSIHPGLQFFFGAKEIDKLLAFLNYTVPDSNNKK